MDWVLENYYLLEDEHIQLQNSKRGKNMHYFTLYTKIFTSSKKGIVGTY